MAAKKNYFTLSNVLLFFTYAYLLLPFVLFCLGWLKLWLALPLTALVLFCFFRMMKSAPAMWTPTFDKAAVIKLVVAALLIIGWVFFSGIGKYAWQTEDHATRNVIFEMLVHQPWPVVDMSPPPQYYQSPVALTYYFGFWLPAALVGKVLGLGAGQLFQLLWAMAGVLLLYWLILGATVKKVVIWPLVVFIFFGGMDWIAASIMQGEVVNVWSATPHLEQWANLFQFSSHSTQLYWVYNQAIPAWVATVLLYVQRSNKWMVLVWAATLLCSTLPMVGLLPLAVCFALRNWKEAHGKFRFVGFAKDFLTPENLTGMAVALVLTLFLSGNNQTGGLWPLFYLWGELWWVWLLFIFIEFVPLALLVAKYQVKNPLFYVVLAILLFVMWFQLGPGVDFCMRVSIPALLVLYLMVVDALQESFARRCWPIFAGLCLVLAVAALSSQTEIVRSVAITLGAWAGHGPLIITDWHPMEVVWRDNFYATIGDGFFHKYLLRLP
ncbi:hypothetical protein LJB76_00485 [Clostridia bacterium OttesenSCG-928-O13]|nr:hypothetical protein [Clostridia bacterium OttesenSCG-928-O13]